LDEPGPKLPYDTVATCEDAKEHSIVFAFVAKIPGVGLHVGEQPDLELVSRVLAKSGLGSKPLNVFDGRHELCVFSYGLQICLLDLGEAIMINKDLHGLFDLEW
jgi:hypothetical protein